MCPSLTRLPGAEPILLLDYDSSTLRKNITTPESDLGAYVLHTSALALCRITLQAWDINLPAMTSQEDVSCQAVNQVFLRRKKHQTLTSLVIDSQIDHLPLPPTGLLMK